MRLITGVYGTIHKHLHAYKQISKTSKQLFIPPNCMIYFLLMVQLISNDLCKTTYVWLKQTIEQIVQYPFKIMIFVDKKQILYSKCIT